MKIEVRWDSQPAHYDRAGQPMPFEAWVEAYRPENFHRDRCVARHITPAGHLVSTVWLGIDHSFGSGAPLIFETMVQTAKGEWAEQERYATEADAMAGHALMLEQWQDRPADWRAK